MKAVTLLFYPRVWARKPNPNELVDECDEYSIDYDQLIKHELYYSDSTPSETIQRDIEFIYNSQIVALSKWWINKEQ